MLKRLLFVVGICAVLHAPNQLFGGEYFCTNGEIIKGEPITFKEDGVVFRKDSGGYSDKIQWPSFTQDSLKELAKKSPQAQYYADPFIEVPLEFKAKEVKPPPKIVVSDVERLTYYNPDPSFLSAWITPVGLLLLLALYVANLVTAYTVARFRRKQPALVCGVSAVLPVLGPIIFLTQPEAVVEEEPTEEIPTQEREFVDATGSATGANMATRMVSRAAAVKGDNSGLESAVYKRGDITFNRKFFETKFPTFFRPVLGAKEKAVKFVITVGDKHFEGMRFSRVTTDDIYMVPLEGGSEISMKISEIESVEVKPR
ncbi:MAG: hypothetical protein J6W73_03825 [Verrucomicrobia bacterium]|nr:hypothetical protein [Verrucomicrobiota bacterium]